MHTLVFFMSNKTGLFSAQCLDGDWPWLAKLKPNPKDSIFLELPPPAVPQLDNNEEEEEEI